MSRKRGKTRAAAPAGSEGSRAVSEEPGATSPVTRALPASDEERAAREGETAEHRSVGAREALAVVALLAALLAVAYGNVIFGGASLVYSDNVNPLDDRLLAQNYGPGFTPPEAWNGRNLARYANFHDPGATWWQWEPAAQFLRRAFELGEWPWWDPYVGAGAPAMANLTGSFFFPPYAAVVGLGNGVALRNAYHLFILLVAAASAYAFLRRHACSPVGSFAGAVGILFSGGLSQNVGSFIGQTAACLPPALLLTRWMIERPSWRRVAALAVGYAVLALATFPPLLVAAFGIAALYALVFSLGHGDLRRRLVRYGIAVVTALALSGFAYLPTFALGPESPQVERTYDGEGLLTVPWYLFGQLLSPVLWSGARVQADPPMPAMGSISLPYAGIVVILLAGLAVPRERRDAQMLFAALAASAALVVFKLLGLEPVQSIARLPGFEHVHFAHYFGVPLCLLLALAAGLGLDGLARGAVSRRRLLTVAGGLAALVLAMPAVALVRGALKHQAAGDWLLRWYLLLALLVAAAALAWPLCGDRLAGGRVRHWWWLAGLLLVLAAEGVANTAYPRQQRWDVWRNPPPYVRTLVEHRHHGRVFTASAFAANAGSAFEVFGVDSLWTFNPPRVFELYREYFTPRAYLFLREARGLPAEAVLDAANVGLLAVRESHESILWEMQARGYRELFADGYVRVMSRATEPRYYFTTQYRVEDPQQVLRDLPLRAGGEVLLERAPSFPAHAMAGVEAPVEAEVERNRVRLRLHAPRPGLLYCSESQMSGWSAEVNGKPVPILAANYAFRAVEVPAGEVTVELHYFPPGLRAGLALLMAALLALLGLLWAGRRESAPALSPRPIPSLPRLQGRVVVVTGLMLVAGGLAQAALRARPPVIGRPAAGREVQRREIPRPPDSFYRVKWNALEWANPPVAGGKGKLLVSVENAGTEVWPDPQMADPGVARGRGAVRLGHRWLDTGGNLVEESSRRVDLPFPLRPGESTTLPVEVSAPATPGSYVVQVALVHEMVTWFERRGGLAASVPITLARGTEPPR